MKKTTKPAKAQKTPSAKKATSKAQGKLGGSPAALMLVILERLAQSTERLAQATERLAQFAPGTMAAPQPSQISEPTAEAVGVAVIDESEKK